MEQIVCETSVEMKNKRIEWVDIVKYICIMFVMIAHLESNTNILSAFFTPFFLTGFFLSSGYVYKHKEGFLKFMYKKVRQLFIPWLVFSVFNILLSQIISFNEHASLLSDLKWNFLQIRGKNDGVWFIAALFVAFIPFYFFIKLYENKKDQNKYARWILLGVSFLLCTISCVYSQLVPGSIFPWESNALPWHIEYIFVAMFFMTLGYLFKDYFERLFDKYNTIINLIIVSALYLVIVYLPVIFKWEFNWAIQILYTYISQFLGLVFLISISKRIKTNKYFSYVGQNTLIFFALHGKLYSLIQTALKKFAGSFYTSILNNVFFSSVFAILFGLLLSIILIIPAWIINKFFPFIIGRKYKRLNINKQPKS